jgi:hypothetical protein
MHFQTHITYYILHITDVKTFQHDSYNIFQYLCDFQANFSMTFLNALQAFLSTTFIEYYSIEILN